MRRVLNGLTGAIAFATAHAIEVSMWRQWFDPAGVWPPWFLNNGKAVAFTAACVALAAALRTLTNRADVIQAAADGAYVAAGAAIALAVTLFVVGPGTLAPIAMLIGWVIVGVSAGAGALVGAVAGAPLRR